MRTRKEVESGITWNRSGSPYADDINLAVNLNLESVMQNQGLAIEVLLDIRDLLAKSPSAGGEDEKGNR